MAKQIRILIIAPDGRIRDSLRVLLRAGPAITIAGQAADGAVGLRMVAETSPDLVLLSTDLSGGAAWAVLQQMHQQWPWVCCCVLAQNAAEAQQARQDGAQAVLQVGFTAENLYNLVETVRPDDTAPASEQ